MSPDDPRHGTYAGATAHWNSGAPMCDACRAAGTRYQKQRKLNQLRGETSLVPAIGTRRRLHALCALGWSFNQIATDLGKGREAVRRLATEGRETVTRQTADQVKDCYERLCMTLPDNTNRRRAYFRKRAAERGWLPPLAWDDIDDESERPVTTGRDRYRQHELIEEWEHLRWAGVSIEDAARQIGVTVKGIEKALERTRKNDAA